MTHNPPVPSAEAPADGGGQALPVAPALSVAPSDTSTSIVIEPPTGPQIEVGALGVTAYPDLVYATREDANGQDRPLRLDLLVGQTPGVKPLVVYVPGGGFLISPKESALNRRAFVADAGYAVASVEHRTVHEGATYREVVADVKSAIRFLRAHGAQYGIDTSNVAIWGESAGGYLAAMVGATNAVVAFETSDNSEFSSEVQAVVDYFGPADLLNLAIDFDLATRQAHLRPGTHTAAFVFGPGTDKSLGDAPGVVEAANPARYVTATTPPFLLFHGGADNIISPSQTLTLHNTLLEHGVESTRYVLTGAAHGDLAAMLGDPEGALPWSTQELLGYVTAFLEKHLRS